MGLVVALMLLALFLFYFPRNQPNPLPNFDHYAIGSRFDLGACIDYTKVPYQNSWYGTSEMGYCTLSNYFPPGIISVHLYLNADFIISANIRVSSAVKVSDLLAAWGEPIKINRWGHTTQLTWENRVVMYMHKDGGSVDNVEIRYIYIH